MDGLHKGGLSPFVSPCIVEFCCSSKLVQSEGKQIGDVSPIVPSVCGKTKTFKSLEESWEIKLGPLSRKAGRLNLALS